VATLLLAGGLFTPTIFFAGSKAVFALGISLLTFCALFVMQRLHLFRQKNGGFLAFSLVCLLGAIIALGERAFVAADALIKNQNTLALAPALAHSSDSDAPLLTQSFALPSPDSTKRQVRILKDSKIVIGEKPFAIKTGDLFPYVDSKGSDTTFAVRDLRVALPSTVVEIVEPGAEVKKVVTATDPAPVETKAKAPSSKSVAPAQTAKDELKKVTESAQLEAARRYPALGIQGSRENRRFLDAYHEMKNTGQDDFFANPEWPIILADDLAKSEGWSREGQVVAGSPTASSGAPATRPAVNTDELPPDDLPSVIPKQ
jgi:hypothetical protein